MKIKDILDKLIKKKEKWIYETSPMGEKIKVRTYKEAEERNKIMTDYQETYQGGK